MIKHGIAVLLLFTAFTATSQTFEDAIRQSYQIQQGTARNMAVGGAGGSLGGDLTSAYINPAGIGFYRTGEFVLSPGFNFIGTNYNFRGSGLKDSKSSFAYGPIGFVYGRVNAYNPKKSSAFSISINQVANFNSVAHYNGLNNVSSWSEQYLEELIRNNVTTFDRAENDFPYGSSLAFWTYLIDTINNNGTIGGYRTRVPVGTGIIQENNIVTKGGIHEVNIAFASNNSDRFYFGGSVGIPIYNYTKHQVYTETDATNNTNNDFSSFTYTEDYTSKGVGVNLRLGAIYRPVEKIRLGLSLQSPTFANMTDRASTSITTVTEPAPSRQPFSLTKKSTELTDGLPGQSRYTMTTPWKAIVSGTYIFNEVSDVRRQKGFITVDAEYVRHQGTQYAALDNSTTEDDTYYKQVNQVTDGFYKGTFNFRAGGEVKFTDWMVRAGAAHYGDPNRISALKNNRTLFSGGLGYRNKGIFVDLTYIYTIMNDTNVPYYLTDNSLTTAIGRSNKSNVMMTVGFKF